MANFNALAIFFVASLLIFGCAGQSPASSQGDQPSSGGQGGQPSAQEPTVSISLLSPPAEAEAGKPLSLKWKVESSAPLATEHTAVHFSYSSVPSSPTPKAYAYATQILKGSIPDEFSATITPPNPGILYARAHVIAGGKHYWGNEAEISVYENAEELQKQLDSFDSTLNESIAEVGEAG